MVFIHTVASINSPATDSAMSADQNANNYEPTGARTAPYTPCFRPPPSSSCTQKEDRANNNYAAEEQVNCRPMPKTKEPAEPNFCDDSPKANSCCQPKVKQDPQSQADQCCQREPQADQGRQPQVDQCKPVDQSYRPKPKEDTCQPIDLGSKPREGRCARSIQDGCIKPPPTPPPKEIVGPEKCGCGCGESKNLDPNFVPKRTPPPPRNYCSCKVMPIRPVPKPTSCDCGIPCGGPNTSCEVKPLKMKKKIITQKY